MATDRKINIQLEFRRLDVDAIKSAMVPTTSFPASGFACETGGFKQLDIFQHLLLHYQNPSQISHLPVKIL
jgi:hypothetical protein